MKSLSILTINLVSIRTEKNTSVDSSIRVKENSLSRDQYFPCHVVRFSQSHQETIVSLNLAALEEELRRSDKIGENVIRSRAFERGRLIR